MEIVLLLNSSTNNLYFVSLSWRNNKKKNLKIQKKTSYLQFEIPIWVKSTPNYLKIRLVSMRTIYIKLYKVRILKNRKFEDSIPKPPAQRCRLLLVIRFAPSSSSLTISLRRRERNASNLAENRAKSGRI